VGREREACVCGRRHGRSDSAYETFPPKMDNAKKWLEPYAISRFSYLESIRNQQGYATAPVLW
jgi:hypothetical protein